jgi:hypothetical protein
MPESAKRHLLMKAVGWMVPTPVEAVLFLLVAILFFWGAMPHYERWKAAQLLEEEQHTIMRVRASLAIIRESPQTCPDRLDDCLDGVSAAECGFFTEVLGTPVNTPEWTKADGVYRGPAGGYYRYDDTGCRIVQISAPGSEY